jgi:hypothetical protein
MYPVLPVYFVHVRPCVRVCGASERGYDARVGALRALACDNSHTRRSIGNNHRKASLHAVP